MTCLAVAFDEVVPVCLVSCAEEQGSETRTLDIDFAAGQFSGEVQITDRRVRQLRM